MTLCNVGREFPSTQGNHIHRRRCVLNANALDNELLKLSLSPIAPWVDDPDVTDILVYGSQNVYVRRRGRAFEAVDAAWFSDADLMTAAKTIGRQMARRLDSRAPILDARLPDKSRVNIIVDPCYHRGACIVIRKFPENQLTLEDLIGYGSRIGNITPGFDKCPWHKIGLRFR